MKGLHFLALTALITPAAAFGQSTRPSPNDVVWHWYGACAGRDSLVLEVTLDGQPLYTTQFVVCKLRRGDIKPDPQQRILEFVFSAAPKRFRAGSEKDPQPITADIWEVRPQTDGMHLGVQFSTEKQVLLNTNHWARAQATARSEWVRGLIFTTRPVAKRSPEASK